MPANVVSTSYRGARVPPCIGLMAIQHLRVNVLDSGTGSGTSFVLYIMLQHHSYSNAELSDCLGTSAHETGTVSSLNTNCLRFYTPGGTRRRRASDTAALRRALCGVLLQSYPTLRRVRIKDTGRLFLLTLWLDGGKRMRRKAYNLKNLPGLAAEALA